MQKYTRLRFYPAHYTTTEHCVKGKMANPPRFEGLRSVQVSFAMEGRRMRCSNLGKDERMYASFA